MALQLLAGAFLPLVKTPRSPHEMHKARYIHFDSDLVYGPWMLYTHPSRRRHGSVTRGQPESVPSVNVNNVRIAIGLNRRDFCKDEVRRRNSICPEQQFASSVQ